MVCISTTENYVYEYRLHGNIAVFWFVIYDLASKALWHLQKVMFVIYKH